MSVPALCKRHCPPNDAVMTYTPEVLQLAERGCLRTVVNGVVYEIDLWEPGKPVLQGPRLSLDTETHLIVKGDTTYPVLCQVACIEQRIVQIAAWPHFFDYVDLLMHANPKTVWVMHNGPFDVRVCGLDHTKWLTDMVNENRFIDTGLRFILDSLSRGIYFGVWGLDFMIKRFFGVAIPKDDEIRLGFKRTWCARCPT